MIRTFTKYYRLSKPGIIYGNLLHALAGILFAWQFGVDFLSVVGVLGGTAAIIAAGCIVNNYIDADIDAVMSRTKKRSFVSGDISTKIAFGLAIALLVIGSLLLYALTNTLTLILGLIGFFSYSFIYTLTKRHTPLSTLIGTLPGAIPLLAGYAAISGELNLTAWLLGGLLVAWQMVHFYAISVYRKEDYKAAGVPIISVVKPFKRVVWSMIGYSVLYAAIVSLLFGFHSLSYSATTLLIFCAVWQLKLVLDGLSTTNKNIWARSVFKFSLVVSVALVITAILNILLPFGSGLQ